MTNEVLNGDCLIELKKLPDNLVDSIVTDPPYELGFMGKKWDNSGITYNIDMWKECLRVLKPGGHLLSFGGTRTYHRMACAIEDAGFEVRDMIEWVYGSGFSKCTVWSEGAKRSSDRLNKENDLMVENGWQGWGRGGLKPAHEPICMARKPLSEKTVADNVLKYGTGGINIDGCRVDGKTEIHSNGKRSMYGGNSLLESKTHNDKTEVKDYGRFPANLIHDNSEEVRECFPESKSTQNKISDERQNEGNSMFIDGVRNPENSYTDSGNASRFFKSIIYTAKSSKSERNAGLDKLVLVDIMEVCKEKNTTSSAKLAQLLVGMEQSLPKVTVVSGTQNKGVIEWSIGWFGKDLMEKYQEVCKSTILTETHSITTLQTFNWLLHLLTNEYTADVSLETATGGSLVGSVENYSELIITISEKMALALGVKNVQSPTQLKISVKEGKSGHPTVKPIALMEYLIKMVTPKGGIVLDPFAGSGSTLVAAKQNGFGYIGIELTAEYLPIIEARLSAVEPKLL